MSIRDLIGLFVAMGLIIGACWQCRADELADIPEEFCGTFAYNVGRLMVMPEPEHGAALWRERYPADHSAIALALKYARKWREGNVPLPEAIGRTNSECLLAHEAYI